MNRTCPGIEKEPHPPLTVAIIILIIFPKPIPKQKQRPIRIKQSHHHLPEIVVLDRLCHVIIETGAGSVFDLVCHCVRG